MCTRMFKVSRLVGTKITGENHQFSGGVPSPGHHTNMCPHLRHVHRTPYDVLPLVLDSASDRRLHEI